MSDDDLEVESLRQWRQWFAGVLALHEQRHQWRDRAACKGVPTAVFFPEHGHQPTEALAICQECPVVVECAADGIDEEHGVWAGMTERSRRRHRAARARAVRDA